MFLLRTFFVPLLCAVAAPAIAQNEIHLEQLLIEARDSNPEIQAAQKRYEAAKQRPNQESSLPDPMFSPGYASSGAPWPGARLGTEPTSNIGFMLSQAIPGPGKRRLRGEIAAKEADSEFQQYEAVRLNVAARVKQVFHRLHHTHVAIELMGRGKDLLTRFLRISEARYSAGKGMQADIFRAQTQLSLLETRILRMKLDQRAAEAELNSLLNRRAGSPLGVPTRDAVQPMRGSVEEITASALAQSPRIRRDEQMIQKNELSMNLARKQLRPDYTIAAGYFNMGRMPDMFQFRVDIPLPVYSGRKQIPAIHEQAHRLSESRQNYEAARQDLQFRIRDAYAQAETSFQLMTLYQDTVIPQAKLTADSSLTAYETGSADFLAVLTNLSSTIDYEERYHEEMLAYWLAVIKLEELSGLTLLQ
ncbi:MAG TPA: TolC family protein [Bryobacteraceae bacterium]|nr:TolC family protein [Bryobacteraceae bacterium]